MHKPCGESDKNGQWNRFHKERISFKIYNIRKRHETVQKFDIMNTCDIIWYVWYDKYDWICNLTICQELSKDNEIWLKSQIDKRHCLIEVLINIITPQAFDKHIQFLHQLHTYILNNSSLLYFLQYIIYFHIVFL